MGKAEVSKVLTGVAKRLRSGWTRSTYARDVTGKPVNPKDPEACQFCLIGALMAEVPGPYEQVPSNYFSKLKIGDALDVLQSVIKTSIISFNDNAISVDEVLKVIKKAKVKAAREARCQE